MKIITQVGIILFAVGLTILACSFYRSSSTENFNNGVIGFLPLQPHSWNIDPNSTDTTPYILAPRTMRMDVKTNSTIDFYILNRDAFTLWNSEEKLEPDWSCEGVNQDIYTVQIKNRNEYFFLIYNPSNSAVDFAINCTLYDLETDLLWASIVAMTIGLILIGISKIFQQNQKKLLPKLHSF
ncbi:MAG: hypothetical protein JW702_11180 [Clostridiales bacterium]|nr:hypothetical protein [Clostridiales bacterium]